MTFAQPYFLLLLLLLPLLAWLKGRHGREAAFLYSSIQLVKGITSLTRSRAGSFLPKLRWLALAFFIVALARPQLGEGEAKITASGIDIVVALDLSGSMTAKDFEMWGQRVDRITIAKDVLEKFIRKRVSDRIGLVAFASQAYIASPLTLDHEYLIENLSRLKVRVIDERSTAIGSALSTAVNRLRGLKSKSKIVILMSDGQNNAGSIMPLTAAEAAQALGVKIYTIGVGTVAMAQYTGDFIDEKTMKAIADKTGGKYYRADSSATLRAIYSDIDQLEKTEVTVKKFQYYRELFEWVLVPGMFLFLLEIILANTVWRKLP